MCAPILINAVIAVSNYERSELVSGFRSQVSGTVFQSPFILFSKIKARQYNKIGKSKNEGDQC